MSITEYGMATRGAAAFRAALLPVLAAGVLPAQFQHGQGDTYTASPFSGFHQPMVEAMLYNPPMDEAPWKAADEPESRIRKIEPQLVLSGRGMPDGSYQVKYQIESGDRILYTGAGEVTAAFGSFELVQNPGRKYPEATRVSYELTSERSTTFRGRAGLRWSRFHGQVKYLDGGWRSTYAQLRPNGFAFPSMFYVPVGDDGHFDARLPARVYSVINVNGAGYHRDAMERWAWDYDLTRDRQEVFTIGRTELYGMHAFNIVGGPPTVFVAFRPTALSRVLRWDADGDGKVAGNEQDAKTAAMRKTPTAIGPELEAADVEVWMNGVPQKIAQLNQIPEYNGDYWQVQYLLQFYPQQPTKRVPYGVWHEIKLEVRSRENLGGKEMVDFGQGSVGFYRK